MNTNKLRCLSDNIVPPMGTLQIPPAPFRLYQYVVFEESVDVFIHAIFWLDVCLKFQKYTKG
jgi:hypothetical protein